VDPLVAAMRRDLCESEKAAELHSEADALDRFLSR
jgi:hypothetical protein